MSMSRIVKSRRDGEDVNLAPLIAMVFILLIFFMATTTFVRDAKIEIERPGAKRATVADSQAIRVSLGKRGELFVETRPVKPWMLQARVRDALAGGVHKNILVIADERVDTGKLVEVVDQRRLAGARDVGVAVERG